MFEDALMESTGSLKTRTRLWAAAALAMNATILAVMIVLPLLHPETLPLRVTPPAVWVPHHAELKQQTQAARSRAVRTVTLIAPHSIPSIINMHPHEEPMETLPGDGADAGPMTGVPLSGIISATPGPIVVVNRPKPPERVNVSRGVIAGYLLSRTQPVYPPIARAAGVSGTVVLHAVISKQGTIEGLTVESGPAMLRQAALDGVRGWRYRPYLLNGEPTEVDTTITVNFTNGG